MSDVLTLRPLLDADLPALPDLLNQAFASHDETQWYAPELLASAWQWEWQAARLSLAAEQNGQLVGATLVGPKNSQYSTPSTMSQETLAEVSPAATVSPVGAGAASPPQATNMSTAISVASNNLNERKNINRFQ